MELKDLIEKVESTRTDFIEACSGLTREQSHYKFAEGEWSIADVAEHIVHAE